MNNDRSPAPDQGADRPVTRRMKVPLTWPDGLVREAFLALLWEPTDPLAVALRVATPNHAGTAPAAQTWTVARSVFGDLVRHGVAHPAGGKVGGHRIGTGAFYCLQLHAGGGELELIVPMIEVVKFLAATDRQVPAGGELEHDAIEADLEHYLAVGL